MSQFLFLDSGPLGLLIHPQRSAEVVAVTQRLSRRLLSGSRVIVPAIVYYELKRELLRAKKSFGVARLDAFVAVTLRRSASACSFALSGVQAGGTADRIRRGEPRDHPELA